MKLIALLLAFAVDRFFSQITEIRRFDWLFFYANWLRRTLPSPHSEGPLMVLLLLLAPVLIVLILLYILHYFALILSIVLLIYCLGPKPLESEINTVTQVYNKGDDILLKQYAADLVDGKTYGGAHADVNNQIIDALFVEANDRYFSAIFWFVLLGPVGALTYRCSSQYSQYLIKARDQSENLVSTAIFFHKVMDWLPAQLIALSYTITGSFIHAIEQWRTTAKFDASESVNASVIINTGRAAVLLNASGEELSTQIQIVMALIWRTVWVWVVAVAIFTLAGWIQ